MQDAKASRAFLLAAIGVGVLAMVLAFAYLQGAAETKAANAPKVKILVAAHDLAPYTMLDPDRDLVEKEIPKEFKEWRDRCLVPEFKNAYKGARVNRWIRTPQPVMQADIAASADLELTGDQRAMSIPVRGPAALGGNLVPGDWVKVFALVGTVKAVPATMSSTGNLSVSWAQAALVVPQELKVLAVGTQLSRSRLQITQAAQFDTAAQSEAHQSVTLQVNEAQAQRLLEAMGVAQTPMWLVLCPGTKEAAATQGP